MCDSQMPSRTITNAVVVSALLALLVSSCRTDGEAKRKAFPGFTVRLPSGKEVTGRYAELSEAYLDLVNITPVAEGSHVGHYALLPTHEDLLLLGLEWVHQPARVGHLASKIAFVRFGLGPEGLSIAREVGGFEIIRLEGGRFLAYGSRDCEEATPAALSTKLVGRIEVAVYALAPSQVDEAAFIKQVRAILESLVCDNSS